MSARRRVALIAQDPGHAHRFKERLYCGQICRLVTIAVQAARAEEILKAGLRAAPASIAERASSNRPSRANNGGVDEVGPQPPQPRGDSILIRSRHAAETNDVGGRIAAIFRVSAIPPRTDGAPESRTTCIAAMSSTAFVRSRRCYQVCPHEACKLQSTAQRSFASRTGSKE